MRLQLNWTMEPGKVGNDYRNGGWSMCTYQNSINKKYAANHNSLLYFT